MNMNKKILLFIITLFSFFFVNKVVLAANCDNYGCAKCIYKTDNWKFEYNLLSDGDGTAELNFSGEKISNSSDRRAYKFSQSLVSQNFISQENNTLVCPSKLYYIEENGGVKGNVVNINVKVFGSEQRKNVMGQDKIVTSIIDLHSSSTNNNKKLSGENTSKNVTCSKEASYGNSNSKVKTTVTLVNGNLKYEFDKSNFKVGSSSLKPEDFSNGCPNYYVSCGSYNNSGTCSFSMTNDFSMHDYKASESKKEGEIGDCGVGYTRDASGNCNECRSGYYRYGTQCLDVCPEGTIANDGKNCEKKAVEHVADKPCQDNDVKKTFRLFGYLLVVAKILVPLIIIIIGSFDIFKAVSSQDDKSLTKQLKILIWRIIGGLTIFFLPTIVGAFFTISSDINVTEDEDYKICANCLLDPFNKQVCNVNDDDIVTSSTTTTTNNAN